MGLHAERQLPTLEGRSISPLLAGGYGITRMGQRQQLMRVWGLFECCTGRVQAL